MLGENEKGLTTLFALSNLLRHDLDHPDEMVSLREELHYTESYLLIQKNRFGEHLQVEIEVPEEFKGVQIPFLSLQPLVENACIHGLEPKEGIGHLWIKGKKLANKLEVSVSDDGVGISPRSGVLNLSENNPIIGGIGLRNVHKRLQLQFGNEFGVKLKSEPGLTTVSLVIPSTSAHY